MNLKCDKCMHCRCSLCNNEGHIPMKCDVIIFIFKYKLVFIYLE